MAPRWTLPGYGDHLGDVIGAPFDAPWVRMAVLADPAGATFIASQFVPENRALSGQPERAASTP